MSLRHSHKDIVDGDEQAVLNRAVSALESIGYTRSEPGIVKVHEFHRGSLGSTWIAISPRLWMTVVKIYFYPADVDRTEVQVEYEITTSGQIVTRWETAYWRKELAMLAYALRHGEFSKEEIDREVTIGIGLTLLFIIASIILSGFAGLWVGLRQGFVAGMLAFLVALCLVILPFRSWRGLADGKGEPSPPS